MSHDKYLYCTNTYTYFVMRVLITDGINKYTASHTHTHLHWTERLKCRQRRKGVQIRFHSNKTRNTNHQNTVCEQWIEKCHKRLIQTVWCYILWKQQLPKSQICCVSLGRGTRDSLRGCACSCLAPAWCTAATDLTAAAPCLRELRYNTRCNTDLAVCSTKAQT